METIFEAGQSSCAPKTAFTGKVKDEQEATLAFLQAERKRLQAALYERNDQLRLIADAFPGKVAYVDAQQRYQFINKQYEDWYQVPAEQIIGKTVNDLMGKSSYQSIQNYIEAALAGQRVNYEFTGAFEDGKDRCLGVSYLPHLNQMGATLGFFVVCQVVTERSR
ncbi:MAG: PAS domain-containing protein [Pseudanabaenales cyanobacterium]|nr:PAS domain-containing protein [Pseudanabaenales cyanobacterium]